jgi:hypothetical protein
MTFRRSNQKQRTKKSHVIEHIFLSPVKKNTKNSQRIRENWINVFRKLWKRIIYNIYKKNLNTLELTLGTAQQAHQRWNNVEF